VRKPPKRLQIGDQIVLLLIVEDVLIAWHAVSALVDAGADVGLVGGLSVVQLAPLEKTFEARPHLLFVAIGVMADGALFEYFLTFGGIAFGSQESRHRAGGD